MLEIIRIRKRGPLRVRSLSLAAVGLLCLHGCGYNRLERQDEDLRASWSDVVNQYERRADLIPNLTRTVKGYANQQLQDFVAHTEARAREAASIQPTPELVNNPQAFAKFQEAQGQLSAALKDLFAVTDAYPQLQSDANFRDLELALEGTEDRIAAARSRYIDAVRNYNVTVRSFPSSLTAKVFDYTLKPNFTMMNEQAMSQPSAPDVGDTPSKAAASATPPSEQPARR